MIGFLKKHFLSRNGEYRIETIYHVPEKHVETIANMQHQIDQLSAAVIELRNANMARQEQDQQKQSRAIVKQPSEVVMSLERALNLPRKLSAMQVVEGPDVVSKHIYNAQGKVIPAKERRSGEPWKPIPHCEPYVKPKRYAVEWDSRVSAWMIKYKSPGNEYGMMCVPLNSNCDAHREAAERIAAIYEEVAP